MPPVPPLTNIAIVGASGRIGSHFVTSLLATGKHTVTAITRTGSSTTKDSFPAGIKLIAVDYNDPVSLTNALKGQQFLAITLNREAPPDTHSKIVDAAIQAGVKYIMPNAYGLDWTNPALCAKEGGSIFSQQSRDRCLEIERRGGMYVGAVCGFWYEWSLGLFEPWYGFNIRNRTVTFFDDGEIKFTTSTWTQCGRALAALLSLPESGTSPSVSDWSNKPFFFSSFTISQRDMLDSLHRVLGTTDNDWKIKYENTTARYERGLKDMREGKLTGFATAMYTRSFFPDGAGNFDHKGLVNDVLGLEKEDLDEATRRTVKMVEDGYNPFTGNKDVMKELEAY